ncbi:MAG: hypothetical protein D6713_00845 [Deltaproteobacteria bacterium]|nr:MAG: hypothetical protein D6713_00845 [Deltaproteobacteria bacterium]
MGKTPVTGKSGGFGSGGTVILTGNQVAPKPAGLIDAVSEIQQYYIIEKTGQEIPKDFLTLRGTITFVMIGLKSGFVEGLFFALVIPLVLTFSTAMFLQVTGLKTDWFFQFLLYLTAFSPVVFNTFLCCYIGKYYVGNLTKKAVNCLLNGRSAALVFKGFIVFFLFLFLNRWLTPEVCGNLALRLKPPAGEKAYVLLLGFSSHLPEAAYLTLATSLVASAVPFLSVYFQDHVRRRRVEKALKILEDA